MSRATGAAGTRRQASSGRSGGMLRTNALLAASSGVIGLTSYACALLMARLLPVSAYSDFSAGQTLLTTVGVAASAMVPMPLARVVRTYPRGSEQRRLGVAFAMVVSLLIGLVAGGVLTGVASLFAGPGIALVVGMCALGLFAIMPVWGWLQGESRFAWYALLSIAEVSLRLTSSLISALVGWGAEGVLASYLVGVGIVMLVGTVLLRRDLSWNPRVLADGKRWRETSGIAVVQLAVSALVSTDVMLVAIMAGHTAAGAGYQAIATLAKGPVYVAAGTALISFPALCAARPAAAEKIIRSTFSSFGWLAIPTAIALATVPTTLALKVLPARYAPSFPLLPWLAIAGLELGAVSVLTVVLLALGTYRRSVAAMVCSAVFVLGGIAAGWSQEETRGLSIGVAGGAMVAVIAVIAIASPYLPRGLGNSAARAVVRAAVAAAALVLARPVPWLWLLTVTVIAVLAFRGGGNRSRSTKSQSIDRSAPSAGRLRITHLGFEDPAMPGAGGGSHRTHEIDRRLAAQGHRLTVLVTRFPGCADRVQDGVEYVHVGFGKGTTRLTRLLGYLLALPVKVRRYPADLVVEDFFAPISTMAAPLWAGRPTVGMVQWLNARDKARQYHLPVDLIERFGVRRYRYLVAVSEATAQQLSELNPSAHIAVVSNGVDQAAFAVTAERGQDVVFVGRLETAQKGLDLLLKAWAGIAPQLVGQLVIAGRGPDETSLRELTHKLGVADRVRFLGWIGGVEKYRLMAAARVVVVPSRFETFGIVAAEALATGTPVLAFDIPCLREVIPSGCGRLVAPFNVEAFARGLLELYRENDWRIRASSQGRQFARAYDWDTLAVKQEKIYRGVATGDLESEHDLPGLRTDDVREQLRGLGRRHSVKRSPRLTIIGNVGNGNTGDEALLAVTLAKLDPSAEVMVISRNPQCVAALHGVLARPMTMRSACLALLRCDGLVVVGGGMFGPGLPPLVRLLPTVATWVRRSGRDVAYVGIGVYPRTPRRTLGRLRRAAERSEVTVRDAASIRTLDAQRPVRLVGDLACQLVSADPDLARNVLAHAGIPADQPLLLVAPKAAPTSAQTEEVIGALTAAVRNWTSRGGAVAAIALADHADFGRDPAMTDSAMAEIVAERASVGVPVVGPNLDPALAKAIVGQATAVVGFRFHALVFALSTRTPCMGFPGEPKSEALLEENRLPIFTGIEALQGWLDTIPDLVHPSFPH
jgi:glycosyltransferase involved in cell wall biosynthesis/polysaccharide pyruvyl transferase WcaK-like protein/O-antigen/teichoic acid export membrane protein